MLKNYRKGNTRLKFEGEGKIQRAVKDFLKNKNL